MSATKFRLTASQTTPYSSGMTIVTLQSLPQRVSQLFVQQQPDHIELSHWLSNSAPSTISFKRRGLDFTAKVDTTELLSMIDIIMSLPGNTPDSEYYCSFRANAEEDVNTPGRLLDYSSTSLQMDSTVPLPLSKIRDFIAVQELAPPCTVDLHIFLNSLSLFQRWLS